LIKLAELVGSSSTSITALDAGAGSIADAVPRAAKKQRVMEA
jgi:hypothetical protein